MLVLTAIPMLLGVRLMLPDYVGGPGEDRVAVGAGVHGLAPVADVRWGMLEAVSLTVEGVFNKRAPRLGVQLRGAAGRSRGTLFALAFLEGHLRPVFTTEVSESIAGGDVGGGLGVVALAGFATFGLDGGVALGLPAGDTRVPGVDATQVDQQGGFFGLQRAFIAADLGEHFELALQSTFAVPVSSVSFKRRSEDVLGAWNFQLGARIVVRF